MRAGAGRQFAEDEGDLETLTRGAKQLRCQHCGRIGTLNRHGFLRGYSESGRAGVVRGRRLFCSNRGRRPGCGRTVAVLLSTVLAGFVVSTATVTQFVTTVLRGGSRRSAWSAATPSFAESTGYRLWRRLGAWQSRLRTILLARARPPQSEDIRPLAQLWAHLEGVCGGHRDPLAAFQRQQQIAIFR